VSGSDSAGGDGGATATPGGTSPAGDGGDGDVSDGGAGGAASGAITGGGGGGGGGLYAAGGGGGGASASGGGCLSGGIVWNDFYSGAGGGGASSFAASPIGTPTITDGDNSGNGALDITFEVRPDVVTGGASAITATTVSLAGSVNPNEKATTYYIEYGESMTYGSLTSVGSVGSGATPVPITGTLSGLNPSTTYHYRVVATTCGGCVGGTATGDDGTFTTQAQAAPSPGPSPSTAPTGQRAGALKKCKKKRTAQQRRKCKKKANRLPV
jgi:hypothetical protein